MRSVWAVALAGILVPVSTAAMAGTLAAVTPESVIVKADIDPLIPGIKQALEIRAGEAQDANERHWLSELQGYYGIQGSRALWVDRNGLTAAGRSLLEELNRADDYGLEAAQLGLPAADIASGASADLARLEAELSFAAVKYVWHARGGRIDPSKLSLWLDQQPRPLYASQVIRAVTGEAGPAKGLLSFHPKHPQFELLRQAYLMERGGLAPAPVAVLPVPGQRLVRGDRHPDVIAIRKLLNMPAGKPENADLLDGELFYEVKTYVYEQGFGRKKAIDDEARQALMQPPRKSSGNKAALLNKYRINLERWRWMPESMGDLHVWNNLPEFETRLVKNGDVIHQERIIIGQNHSQTPVFSNTMRHVVFQPEWGVPESIKLRQIIPYMRGGDYGVLARRNMRISDGVKTISPSRINWTKASASSVPIIQGPGPGNPLGKLKFVFPNGHDVYMHDTIDKDLFNSKVRNFSHGCIRVRNPARLAEVILAEQGWTPDDVAAYLKQPKTRSIDLVRVIPVHNTYFTLLVGEDGKLASFNDIYGHDKRIGDALAGKSIQAIAANDPAAALKRANKELMTGGAVFAKKRVAAAGPRRTVASFGPPMALGNKPLKFSKPAKGPAGPPVFKLFLFQ